MFKVAISANFTEALETLKERSKIVDSFLNDIDANKFKEVLGLVRKAMGETEEELTKRNLTKADIKLLVHSLIREIVVGPSWEIKCVISNFVKAGLKKDSLMKTLVGGV